VSAAPPAPWPDALAAAALLAVDPAGLGGAVLRARAGPVRAAWLERLHAVLPEGLPRRRAPPEIADDRLLGGLDLAATLESGRPAFRAGVLAEADGGVVILPMGERTQPGLAGRLAAAIDRGGVVAERDGRSIRAGTRFGLVVLDEGAEDTEAAPPALAERLAFRLDLSAVPWGEAETPAEVWSPAEVAAARARLGAVALPEAVIEAVVRAAAAMGIGSMRAPLLAIAAARAAAALAARDAPGEAELALAARLVLAHRATALPEREPEEGEETEDDPPPEEPEAPEDTEPEAPEDASPPDDSPAPAEDDTEDAARRPPEDVMVDAARAAIPADLLERLAAAQLGRGARAGMRGARQKGAGRGRPAGSRPATPGSGQRLDIVGTLRTAAPWQPVRRRTAHQREGLIVSPADLRAKRFVHPAESVLIFVVDASGSSAAGRLAEAKGAVEIMLARAYERREQVALVGFRGTGAEILLPPTRSLTRARRELRALPGGGGTPLAAGLMAGLALAERVRAGGATPYLALLTDGRGNVALDGTPGRQQAAEDASRAARELRARGVGSVLIDTASRQQRAAQALAAELGARYLAMPRADARALGAAVRAAVSA
jgi:magnesium chelatase subunit D